ncbi:Conserved hypothetical protein [gamma proteobacterium HdN1]|nr:Conserved hypothetical protein [gamma proteobacterium HdN1]
MIRNLLVGAVGSLMALGASQTMAWSQPTHKWIVMDALAYMGSDRATPEEKRAYDFYVEAANGQAEVAADALGQACYDVDNFRDVHIGSWWAGGHWSAPVFGLAHSLVGYNAYHHFINMTRGEDVHGNAHGGYSYQNRTPNGSFGKGDVVDIDKLAAIYLWNQELSKRDFNTTEAHYRQGSYSDWNAHYRDFQNISWQPSANAGEYWLSEFYKQPSFQAIGYALHFLTDSAQPHHAYSTSANNHVGWENWVEDHYKRDQFADFTAVRAAVGKYNPRDSLNGLITQVAGVAYTHPEPLFAKDYETRKAAAQALIPEAIAATVAVLTKAVNCLNDECGL